MTNLISSALFFLAAGYLTSVSILSGYQVLITIPLIFYTYKAFKTYTFTLPKSGLWLLGFTIIASISLFMNLDVIPKPSKNFGRLKYFLIGITSIWVLKDWIISSSSNVKKFILNTFFTSVIIAGGYAIYTYTFNGVPRAHVLTETMRYGYGSGMILLILLGMILHREKFQNILTTPLAITAFIVGFTGMYLTYTRGALLGFLCGFPFVIFYYKRKLGYILGGLSIGVVIILAGFYLFGSGQYKSRFLVSKNNKSDSIRKSQWQAAIIAIKERPLFGWGLSNFHSQLKRIKEDHDLAAKDYNDAHSHNLFLEIGSGTGLIGLLLFLGWIFTWAGEIFKHGGILRALIIPYGVAFVVSSQFEVTFDANNASVIFFLYSLSMAYLHLNSAKPT